MNKQTTVQKNYEISKRSFWSAVGLMFLLGFTFLQFWVYIIPGVVEISALKPETTDITKIGLMWVPFNGYLLFAGNIYLLVNILKPLKARSEGGLIMGLVVGLALSLILGLALILLVVMGLVVTLVGGLVGLVVGLALSLILALIKEFK